MYMLLKQCEAIPYKNNCLLTGSYPKNIFSKNARIIFDKKLISKQTILHFLNKIIKKSRLLTPIKVVA